MKVTFGKYNGMTLEEIYAIDASYISWLAEKAFKNDVRSAAATLLRRQETAKRDAGQALREQFVALARSANYPGITGQVRFLDVECRLGYASIEFGSMDADEDDEYFAVELSTAHPQFEEYVDVEGYEDDYRAPRVIEHDNRNLTSNEMPSLDRPVWWAIDVNEALNAQPVTACEALMLLSQYLSKQGA